MEIVVRILVAYLFIIVILRVIGKREFAELSPSDLVMLLLIPDIVSKALGKNDFSMTLSLVSLGTLLLLVFVTSLLSYRFKRFGAFVEGEATTLVNEWGPIPGNMDRERVSMDEIRAQLRMAGFDDLSVVKAVVLEADGDISVVPMRQGES